MPACLLPHADDIAASGVAASILHPKSAEITFAE
jgi:hypothetical protein